MKKLPLLTLLISLSLSAGAHTPDQMAGEFLQASNKLYVVIAVLVTIFAALIIFLIFQDRRISRLEKQLKDKTHEQESQS
jgi:hypothetical protein